MKLLPILHRQVIPLLVGIMGSLWFSTCELPAHPLAETCSVATFLDSTSMNYVFPYRVDDPDDIYILPGRLEEISGLSMSADGKHFLAVQDEDGEVYWIGKKSRKVEKELKFWKDGDYEGIEVAPQGIFVLKSSGTLYQVEKTDQEEPKVTKYNTFLDSDNDVEGLAYDAKSQQLLLACKAASGTSGDLKLTKAIYAFDLNGKFLKEEPKFCIRLEDVHQFLKTDPVLRKLEKIQEFFAPGDSELGFSPSAIAKHPRSGNLYILSSVGKILMVVSPQGQILHIEKMKKSIHAQPEGICFDADGTLYISNEGKGGKGRILRFNFLP